MEQKYIIDLVTAKRVAEAAKVALTFRRSTRLWEEMVDGGRYEYLNMPGMLPLEGGEPLVYEGEIVGIGRKLSGI